MKRKIVCMVLLMAVMSMAACGKTDKTVTTQKEENKKVIVKSNNSEDDKSVDLNKMWLGDRVTDEEKKYNQTVADRSCIISTQGGLMNQLDYIYPEVADMEIVGCGYFWRYTGDNREVSLPSYLYTEKSGQGDLNEMDEGKGSLVRLNIIPNGAFQDASITKISVPSGYLTLLPGCFSGCQSLSEISLPDTLRYVDCKIMEGTAWYEKQPEGLLYIDSVCLGYKGKTSDAVVEIKEGTTCIADGAFRMQDSITTLIIPDSVVSCDGALCDIPNLKEIKLGQGIRVLGDVALLPSLESLVIPDGVIMMSTFKKCKNLTKIYIPASVKEIVYEDAFDGCAYDLTIYGEEGSYIQRFAKKHYINFVVADSLPG